MGAGEGFLYGIAGGVLAELLGWFKLRHAAPRALPRYSSSLFYWVVTILMIAAGGGMVFAYIKSGAVLNPILAINIGASAPLIISALVNQTPRVKID